MKRLSIALVLAFSAVMLWATPALAGTQQYGSPCTGNRWLLYENRAGDTSDGDDRLWLCNFNGPVVGDNLDIDHALPGVCKAPVQPTNWWSNCASSVYVVITDTTRALCIYSGWGYSGTAKKFNTSNDSIRVDLHTFSLGDTIQSFRWVVYNQSC